MKFTIKTYGCQMNVYDSRRIREILEQKNFQWAEDTSNSDFLIINTCSVREKPREKVISVIRNEKASNKGLKVIVTGCVAQLEGESLLKDGADLVLGPDWYNKLPEAVNSIGKADFIPVYDGFITDNPEFLKADPKSSPVTVFLPIQKGCDNFCTYCVVPMARGPERSRKSSDILDEVKLQISKGAKEIYLLGQNVNSYKGEGGFATLLNNVASVDGVERVRFTTSHPKDLSIELMDVMATHEKVMPWIHLPVQSGSNNILRRMGRKYTREHYLDLVHRFKNMLGDISFTTDIIVGFPGETRADFEDTMSIIEEVGYEGMYSFKYSKRPNTAALKLDNHIEESVKAKRLKELQSKHEELLPSLLMRYKNKVMKVLVEGPSSRNPAEAKGRIPQNIVVNFQLKGNIIPNQLVGTIVDVLIKEVRTHTLYGTIM